MTAPIAMILAGGTSRRMGGGDKGLLPLGTSTVLSHVIGRLHPQVAALALNTNSPPAAFQHLGLPVHADTRPGHLGPLAGLLTALTWAKARGANHVFTAPGDTPFLPGDLIPQLMLAAENSATGTAIAATTRPHPTCGLWPTSLAPALQTALETGTRRMTDWTDTLAPGLAQFPATTPDPFFNINTPDDLAKAQTFL